MIVIKLLFLVIGALLGVIFSIVVFGCIIWGVIAAVFGGNSNGSD